MADIRIDFARLTRAENAEVARQLDPKRELRSQADRKRMPDSFQPRQEREGRSEWSGGSMGGGTWAGRTR